MGMEPQERGPLYGVHEFDRSKRSWCLRCGESEKNVNEHKIYLCRRRRTPEEAQASMKRHSHFNADDPDQSPQDVAYSEQALSEAPIG